MTCRSTVPAAIADRFLIPRDDLLLETDEGDGRFGLAEGPFHHWEREVVQQPAADDQISVVETTTFAIAAPVWGWLFVLPLRRRIGTRHRRIASGADSGDANRLPAWLPPDRLDARASSVLSTLSSLALLVGYLGTVITQTIVFAADQFGASTSDQSTVLASVRIGVLLSLGIVVLADRRGRRRLLLVSIALSCLTAALGAAATGMWSLAASQTVSRAFSTSAVVLLAIMAAEEMPRNSRAYAVGVMTLSGGLGAGMCVWLLPLADTGPGGWRWLYVVPLIGLVPLQRLRRVLPETKRFVQRHVRVPLKGHVGRLALVGTALFAAAIFTAPASQLQNAFLKNERGFDATRIALFTLVTSTPAGLGIAFGGRLADTRGRRLIGAFGVVIGAVFASLGFFTRGWSMWATTVTGSVFGATAVPTLAVYGPELFPTSLRGKANGILQAVAVAGSSTGLLLVGYLVDRWGRMGPAMSVVLVGPIVVALLLAIAYPETAHRTLEDVNPEDAVDVAPT